MKNLLKIISIITLFFSSLIVTQAQSNEISMDFQSTIGDDELLIGSSLNYYLQSGPRSYYGVKLSYFTDQMFRYYGASLENMGVSFVKSKQSALRGTRRFSFEYGITVVYHQETWYLCDAIFCGVGPTPRRLYENSSKRVTASLSAGLTSGIKYDWKIFKKFRIGAAVHAQYLYNINDDIYSLNFLPTLTLGYKW